MSDEPTIELSRRMREAAGRLDDNEDQPTTGMMNVHVNPEGRKPGTLDAKWGDNPPARDNGYPDHYGEGVMREAKDDRHGVLKRVFDGIEQASNVAEAEVAQNFAHGASGNYEAHSPLLNRQKTAEHVPDEGSLTDKVLRTIGRR